LEEGIDYPYIRLVIYIDFLHSFIGFLQGSSRGGRDNRKSTSIFFYLKQDNIEEENIDSLYIDSIDIDKCAIQDYIRERTCRRRIIHSYLDNNIIDKCSNNASKCDLCSNRDYIQASTISNLLESNKTTQGYRDSFKDLIIQLNTYCIFCFLLHPNETILYTMHKAMDCPKYYSSLSKEVNALRQSIKTTIKSLSKDSCCFFCYLPTITCSALKRENSKCCSFNLMFYFAALCIHYYRELNLEEELKVKSFGYKFNYYSLIKGFFKPIFLNDLDTQAIRGIELLQLVVSKIQV
jgi:hypothetical protein